LPGAGLSRRQEGGLATAVLNAANEVAVEAFLARRIGFMDIERVIEETLDRYEPASAHSLEDVVLTEDWARGTASEAAKKGGRVG
jgi:1-deoxy-D-xylulose-5-phosphate reductoisomerase